MGHCSLVSGNNPGQYSEWECNGGCIPFTDTCNGACYGDLEKCGSNPGHCIPKIPHVLSYFSTTYTYWNCQGQCILENQKCESKCAGWMTECGDRCVHPSELSYKYKVCQGKCIPASQECTGLIRSTILQNLGGL